MPLSSSFLVFIIFNILAGAYNLSALRTIMEHTPANSKPLRLWWQFTKHIVYANQLIFGASMIMWILTYYTLLPAMIDTVTFSCFILSGTINFLAVFYLTPFYISYLSHPTKKHILVISLAVLLSGFYSVFHTQFTLELLNALEKNELYKFFNPLSRYISTPMLAGWVFSMIINIYFLDILLHLHRKTTSWKRLFIDGIFLGAGFNFFILCGLIFENAILFTNNFVSSSYFQDFDHGEFLFRFFLFYIIMIINLFFVSLLTPFYAYSKFRKSLT